MGTEGLLWKEDLRPLGHGVTKGAHSRKRAGEQRWGERGVIGAGEDGAGGIESQKTLREEEGVGWNRWEGTDPKGFERRGEHLLSMQWK